MGSSEKSRRQYRIRSIVALLVVSLGYPLIRANVSVTASEVEILWTLTAVLGIWFAVDSLREAIGDDRARIAAGGNGSLRVITRARRRTAGLAVCYLVYFLEVGINTLFLPPRNVRMEPTAVTQFFATIQTVIVPWGFLAMIVTMVWNLYADRRDGYAVDGYESSANEKRFAAIEAALTTSFERAGASEMRMDVSDARADVAQATAEAAAMEAGNLKPRVGTAEEEIVTHTGEITDHTDRLDAIERRGV